MGLIEKWRERKTIRKELRDLTLLRIQQAKDEKDPEKRAKLDVEISLLIKSSVARDENLAKKFEIGSNFVTGMASIGTAASVVKAGHIEAMSGVIDTSKENQTLRSVLIKNIGVKK